MGQTDNPSRSDFRNTYEISNRGTTSWKLLIPPREQTSNWSDGKHNGHHPFN
jgi:hypothetical protein